MSELRRAWEHKPLKTFSAATRWVIAADTRRVALTVPGGRAVGGGKLAGGGQPAGGGRKPAGGGQPAESSST